MSLESSAAEYTSMESAPRKPNRLWMAVGCVLAIATSATVVVFGYFGGGIGYPLALKVAPPVVHTGEWCTGSGAATYTKATLKAIVDRTIAGLLTYEVASGESKFEASDVIRVGESFISVCDSSWSILKLSHTLPLLSREHQLIKHDASFTPPDDEDSGFEAIMHDASSSTDDYYVVRESVEHARLSGPGSTFDAQILKVQLHGDSYHVEEYCHSEFTFEGASKGFEGAVSLRGQDGVLYILGLCEGNYCSEKRGKEVGNGRVVVMAREDKPDAPNGCWWRTVKVLELPPSVRFVDFSAFAVHHSTQAVAVTSQENSQLWVAELSGASDGAFDPSTAAFTEGKVYDFPRTSGACEVQYCNIEGIHWVSGTQGSNANGLSPQMLVAVSDKMKSKGRQPASCFEKDQSVHLFALP